ncbi:MAG: hypothetical protein JXQ75_18800 [Phycisphaerae bacterium]|nr:hypothetical protein [Phycisphaerae bacterium]
MTIGNRQLAIPHPESSIVDRPLSTDADRQGATGARRAWRTSCRAVRVVGAVFVLPFIVLSTARQASSPALLHSETVSQKGVDEDAAWAVDRAGHYTWLSKKARQDCVPLAARIPAPAGFARVSVPVGSFADWLRYLPTASEAASVMTARSKVVLAADHPNLAAVIALQPHGERLLNATNMLIRLRAEYSWFAGRGAGLAFHFTSGHRASWQAWAGGARPSVDGREVEFRRAAEADGSRESFCCYLEVVFRYASSYSLLDDTRAAEDRAIEAGDIFVRPGRPGHALMILDIATDAADATDVAGAPGEGTRWAERGSTAQPAARAQVKVLLGQGGTPAQTFHVLRNDAGSAWFPITQTQVIDLGKRGVFRLKDLRHWVD